MLLPGLAVYQASQIRSGTQDMASSAGLFAYGASPVRIRSAVEQNAVVYAPFANRDAFLLGQNGRQSVLYFPDTDTSAMVPDTAVVIDSR